MFNLWEKSRLEDNFKSKVKGTRWAILAEVQVWRNHDLIYGRSKKIEEEARVVAIRMQTASFLPVDPRLWSQTS